MVWVLRYEGRRDAAPASAARDERGRRPSPRRSGTDRPPVVSRDRYPDQRAPRGQLFCPRLNTTCRLIKFVLKSIILFCVMFRFPRW